MTPPPSTTRGRLAAVTGGVALLAGVLTACTGDGDRLVARPSEARPFQPAAATVPPGFHEELCPDLRPGRAVLTVRLVAPDALGAIAYQRDDVCSFTSGSVANERGVVATLGGQVSLARTRSEELDPFVGEGGDDAVRDVVLDEDATVLGDRSGERLEWSSSNDGLPLDRTTVAADGLQLDWSVPAGSREESADEWAAIQQGAGVRRGPTASCWTAGSSATYTPPVPQTESIERHQGACHLYLRPGRRSLLRYAEVDLRPRVGLDRLARIVDGRPLVSAVRLEPRAARLDGRRVDRLTYVTTRTSRTVNGEPPGTWRTVVVGDGVLQATWSATPEQWREEADEAHAFLASVRTR